ncbi:hypothetical protein FOZ60_002176 [Perkinsus olseni]|uniref:Uncharacterized protein n=1 Tax=Perkinsus olseni TaxID=32597 RepID=A0A7J6NYT6_PEROL|nr:hypothetical protein FOZ60_002176 [Perkinsus olseni]
MNSGITSPAGKFMKRIYDLAGRGWAWHFESALAICTLIDSADILVLGKYHQLGASQGEKYVLPDIQNSPGNEIAVPASKLDKATDCGSELNPMEAPAELPRHRPLSSDSDFISRNNAEGPQQLQLASLDDGIKAIDEMNRRTVTAPTTILGEKETPVQWKLSLPARPLSRALIRPPIPDGEYAATYGEATIWVGIKTKVETGARMV